MKSSGLPVRAPNLPGTYLPGLFLHFVFINFVDNVLLLHWKKWNPKKKKSPLIKMAPTLKIFGVVSRFLYSGGWQVWTGYVRCFSLVFVSMSSWRLAVRKRLEKSPKRLRKYPSHFPSSRGYSRGERGFWEEDWELNSTVHVCWRCWRRREGTIAAGLTEVWPILKLQEMHSG